MMRKRWIASGITAVILAAAALPLLGPSQKSVEPAPDIKEFVDGLEYTYQLSAPDLKNVLVTFYGKTHGDFSYDAAKYEVFCTDVETSPWDQSYVHNFDLHDYGVQNDAIEPYLEKVFTSVVRNNWTKAQQACRSARIAADPDSKPPARKLII